MRGSWLRTAAFAGALATMAPSCGDSTAPNPDVAGEFTATISGDVSATFSGPATALETDAGWGAQFITEDGLNSILLQRVDSGRPGTGTHDIVVDDFLASVLQVPGPGNGDHILVAAIEGEEGFFSTGGSLQIDASSPNSVSGTITFTARDLTQPAGGGFGHDHVQGHQPGSVGPDRGRGPQSRGVGSARRRGNLFRSRVQLFGSRSAGRHGSRLGFGLPKSFLHSYLAPLVRVGGLGACVLPLTGRASAGPYPAPTRCLVVSPESSNSRAFFSSPRPAPETGTA